MRDLKKKKGVAKFVKTKLKIRSCSSFVESKNNPHLAWVLTM